MCQATFWKESLIRSPVDIAIYRKISYQSNKLEVFNVLQRSAQKPILFRNRTYFKVLATYSANLV